MKDHRKSNLQATRPRRALAALTAAIGLLTAGSALAGAPTLPDPSSIVPRPMPTMEVLPGAPSPDAPPSTWRPVPHHRPRATATPVPKAHRATAYDITYSTEYLYQVWMNGRSIDFRLFDGDEKTTFLLSFDQSAKGGLCMFLKTMSAGNALTPVYTPEALDYLTRCGIVEVAIVPRQGETQRYLVDSLRSPSE